MAYPYDSQYGDVGQALGALIATAIAGRGRRQQMAQPLGTALGFTPESMPTMGPPTRAGAMPAPVTSFPGAPSAIQPILTQPVRNIARLKDAIGEPTMRDIYGSMGVSRTPGSVLQYDEATGQFNIAPGAKGVKSQEANIILRQRDIANKRNIASWRDAVEARLKMGQLAREEAIALRADSDLLKFMLDPEFDLLDDTIKTQMQSQATAAINRLQQRGVKVFTGSRARTEQPAAPTQAVAPVPGPKKTTEQRWNELRATNPSLTDEQIDNMLAIEEASGGF